MNPTPTVSVEGSELGTAVPFLSGDLPHGDVLGEAGVSLGVLLVFQCEGVVVGPSSRKVEELMLFEVKLNVVLILAWQLKVLLTLRW